MSDVKLGTALPASASRDAIHIAVAPATCDTQLHPGQHVGLVEGSHPARVAPSAVPLVGIVDPFLTGAVPAGTPFWLCLYPQTVTGLRHEWTHPAFEPTPLDVSKAWLTDMANKCGVSYDRMMDAIERDDYINMGKNERYKDFIEAGEVATTFKRHCEVVLGRTLERTPYPFSCAC